MTRFLSSFSTPFSDRPAFWFMRQAGRYLPEYLNTRSEAGSFLDLCYNPALATEVTLQPLRRFDMDAAIIFSDILVVPHAMGAEVSFMKGEGPKVEIIDTAEKLSSLHHDRQQHKTFLTPVYEAIRQTRAALSAEKSLIGFSGLPWTLACYMLQGRGGDEFIHAREKLYRDPQYCQQLIEALTQAVLYHCEAQIEAGVNAIQLFDSWAGQAPAAYHEALLINPARTIVAHLKKHHPQIPVITFPRGIGAALPHYLDAVKPDGVSIDTNTPIDILGNTHPEITIQGNIDPLLLVQSGEEAACYACECIEKMRGRKFILNLGHGILQQTPTEHLETLCHAIRETT